SLEIECAQEGIQHAQVTVVPPHEESRFAWDMPNLPCKRLIIKALGKEKVVDIQEIGTCSPFSIKTDDGPSFKIGIEVKAKGPVIIVQFEDRKKNVDSPKLEDEEVDVLDYSYTVNLIGIGVAIIDQNLQEILYFFI